jgi:hypothetical protein
MRKLTLSLCIVILSGVLAACGSAQGKATPRPASAQVGTIVRATMEALLSATPVPSDTPVPSSTPTETATLAAPIGWVVYTNEEYGFELAHPNLYDCKDQCGIAAFINLGNIQFVANLVVASTLTGNGAPFDGLGIDVFFNPDSIPLQDFVEQEKQAILAGPEIIGPPLDEIPFIAGGQTGIKMSLPGNIPSATYIPFPNSDKILIFSIVQQQEGSFEATAEQIISTLRFTK